MSELDQTEIGFTPGMRVRSPASDLAFLHHGILGLEDEDSRAGRQKRMRLQDKTTMRWNAKQRYTAGYHCERPDESKASVTGRWSRSNVSGSSRGR